ncbi:MAG: argininosuccinate lyase [Armatimonadetes bacterium]|nr:argininosuccinate lyase [Armatimonadota bacterium]
MSRPKLWGGAFDTAPDDLAWSFGQSLATDVTLFEEEFEVSLAHAAMLAECGIVSDAEGQTLVGGLNTVRASVLSGTITLPKGAEDLHGAVEALLEEAVGETAKRLHAGRSRNDQIVTMTKLWLRKRCHETVASIHEAQGTLLRLAKRHRSALMPGYTHQQPAQPVTLGYLLLAYFWMLQRDKVRFLALQDSLGLCPMGSSALAGTSLPIDRTSVALELGFAGPTPNALDSVSDRDFVGDALHACATLMQHLSRICQEIVLFSTAEFGFLTLDDAFSTGSSIMPQKRNPDFAELVRGRTGRVIGHWTAFMCTMKALPLGYNRDQQEDKPPLFDAVKTSLDSLELTASMLKTADFHTDRMAEAAENGHPSATLVAERLVALGVPFREAHETVGGWVKSCRASGRAITADSKGVDPRLAEALSGVSTVAAVDSRDSHGGTSPQAIDEQFSAAQAALDLHHLVSEPNRP